MKRENFNSTLGVILAAAGSAVGLGNIWRFPYIVGENGGGAFLLIYLFIVIFLGIPLMTAEMLIGRHFQSNVIGCFRQYKFWKIIGILGLIAAFIILAFYSTVAGWTMHYIYACFSAKVFGTNYSNYFLNFKDNSYLPLFWQLLFLIFTAIIVFKGVQKGIEKYSKILMPILFFMLILLIIRALTLENSFEGVKFYLNPDFSKVTGKTILAAMGQAFFSLSIGMGAMLTYGSYVKKESNLCFITSSTSLSDLFVAFLAGLMIFPTLFAFGYSPQQGPGLVFVTLPGIFEKLPFGNIVGGIFFILLFIAALTSSISVLEVIVAIATEELKFSRKKSTIISTALISFLGVFATLSWNTFKNIHIHFSVSSEMGTTKTMYIFDVMDFLSSNILLPLGALLITLFVGWKLHSNVVKKEVSVISPNDNKIYNIISPVILFVIKFIAPPVILVIFLNGLGII
ncbi:MAG: sodium-dependent transporter [Bacteroidales bacterium]|nr:sodium-dependent transporter [Bacteroidales bacterium]